MKNQETIIVLFAFGLIGSVFGIAARVGKGGGLSDAERKKMGNQFLVGGTAMLATSAIVYVVSKKKS